MSLAPVELNDGAIAAAGSSSVAFTVVLPGARQLVVLLAAQPNANIDSPDPHRQRQRCGGIRSDPHYPAALADYVSVSPGTLTAG